MVAEDNSFRSVGYAYKDFVTSAQRMLSFGDKRYWVPANKLPTAVCHDLGLPGRFCVLRRGSSTPPLEVTHDNTDEMALFQTIDGGSIGWSSKFFLFSTEGACLRGAHLHDPAHMRHDHWKNAVASVGLKPIISDGKVQLCECSGIDLRLHKSCCTGCVRLSMFQISCGLTTCTCVMRLSNASTCVSTNTRRSHV